MPGVGHFAGKTATEHVVAKRAQGEAHGIEAPRHLAVAAIAAQDLAVAILLVWTLLHVILPHGRQGVILALFGGGWMVWKAGHAAHMAWSRLERLHRLTQQEKWEIEHHRSQERQELIALYQLKGFEGRLLEEVVDVLMADNERLLRVMLEEEMGLTLSTHEHPLKHALAVIAAGLGMALLCGGALYLLPTMGIPLGALATIALSAWIASKAEENRLVPAMVWPLALAALGLAATYFMLQFLTEFRELL